MNAERLAIVPERWEHHIVQSSIDQMLNHLKGYELVEIPDVVPPAPEGWPRSTPNLRTAYADVAFARERCLADRLAHEKHTLLHFLNGESACYLTPRHKGANMVLATYHQPPAFMDEIIPDKSHFPLHDGVVVIAPNQVDYFESITGKGKVHLVPLGIEPSFFPFGPPQGRVRRCLFVGNWLRDFPTLVETIRLVLEQEPAAEVACVTPPKNHALFEGLNVRLLTGIPTRELLELYRTSSVFLFPVADCTGNTALLEAMCSGLPVVTNHRTLTTGYVDETACDIVADGDAAAFARCALALLRDPALVRRRSQAVREWVVSRFNWPRIAEIQRSVYAHLGWRG